MPPRPILVVGDHEYEYEIEPDHLGRVATLYVHVEGLRAERMGEIALVRAQIIDDVQRAAYDGVGAPKDVAELMVAFEAFLLHGETTSFVISGTDGVCLSCQARGSVRHTAGRTRKALLCRGGHWIKIDVTDVTNHG
jgi:hypothetical protein